MLGSGAGGQFLEFIPIIDDFVATGPAFLEVVEDRLAGMVVAGAFLVLFLLVILQATVALATFLALLTHFYAI